MIATLARAGRALAISCAWSAVMAGAWIAGDKWVR